MTEVGTTETSLIEAQAEIADLERAIRWAVNALRAQQTGAAGFSIQEIADELEGNL